MPLVMIDLDDTLVQREPLVRAWAEGYVEQHGHDATLVQALIDADQGGYRPRPEFVALASERLGSPFSLPEFRAGVNDAYRLTPGVRGALERTRAAGWKLAVVTNGPVETQARKVEVSGLAELVDAVCIAEEVGVWKPDPLIFRVAAERAGTTLEGAWMIGDNLDADVAGGHGVGARTMWVRMENPWLTFEWGGTPDVVVDSVEAGLDQLLALGNR